MPRSMAVVSNTICKAVTDNVKCRKSLLIRPVKMSCLKNNYAYNTATCMLVLFTMYVAYHVFTSEGTIHNAKTSGGTIHDATTAPGGTIRDAKTSGGTMDDAKTNEIKEMTSKESLNIGNEPLKIEAAQFDGVGVHIYTPNTKRTNKSTRIPTIVFFHGGGWVTFNQFNHNKTMMEVARKTGVMIISVEYRLAPVHIFPESFEDCVKVTKYVLKNYEKLGSNPKRIAIGGDSAGGNLAAAVALKLRDDNVTPKIKLQILIYPPLQSVDFLLPSYLQNKEGFLTQFSMVHMWCVYAFGTGEYRNIMLNNDHTSIEFKQQMNNSYINHQDIPISFRYKPYVQNWIAHGNKDIWNKMKPVMLNPYFAPLLAQNLSSLPSAYVYTGQYDVLRDDGLLYVKRLRDAGVNVSHHHADKGSHGNFNAWRETPEVEACIDGVIQYLKNNL